MTLEHNDDDGRPLRSSPLLEEALDAYRDAEGEVDAALETRALAFSDLWTHPDAPLSAKWKARNSPGEISKSVGVPDKARSVHVPGPAASMSTPAADTECCKVPA